MLLFAKHTCFCRSGHLLDAVRVDLRTGIACDRFLQKIEVEKMCRMRPFWLALHTELVNQAQLQPSRTLVSAIRLEDSQLWQRYVPLALDHYGRFAKA